MPSCKDCLLSDVCVDRYVCGDRPACACQRFKDRNQFVEVVRCKDCIHICLHSSGDFYCSITGTEYKSYELDHYCSYGAKND